MLLFSSSILKYEIPSLPFLVSTRKKTLCIALTWSLSRSPRLRKRDRLKVFVTARLRSEPASTQWDLDTRQRICAHRLPPGASQSRAKRTVHRSLGSSNSSQDPSPDN